MSRLPLDRMIIYELHVGTFTTEGTFEAIIPHLDYLRTELGVTAIELMLHEPDRLLNRRGGGPLSPARES